MVIKADILKRALDSVILNSFQDPNEMLKQVQHDRKVILTSAKGELFNQQKAQDFAKLDHLILIAGHYEAVDERIMSEIDEELSMGDFVMTGGEIAISAVVDAVVRLLPGSLKKEEATDQESFKLFPVETLIKECGPHPVLSKLHERGITKVQLLEYPHYTRPEEFDGKKVPEVLLNGNHADIERWRLQKSFEETLKKRPDLLGN